MKASHDLDPLIRFVTQDEVWHGRLLGEQSPREACRTAPGRKRVIAWLKHLENGSARQAGTPMAEYDYGWMWEELGLSGERR